MQILGLLAGSSDEVQIESLVQSSFLGRELASAGWQICWKWLAELGQLSLSPFSYLGCSHQRLMFLQQSKSV